MVTKSFFLDYGHNVSHLIFASCYVRETDCSRHFNFENFFGSRNYKRYDVVLPIASYLQLAFQLQYILVLTSNLR